jgi:phospholipase/lecithinase/hemolysin
MEVRTTRRLLCLVAAVSWALAVARCDPQVPCYFIFGDSLVDNGNNNYIMSLARANYPPYGIDFAGGPSGRFTNGLTTVDVIGKLLATRPAGLAGGTVWSHAQVDRAG